MNTLNKIKKEFSNLNKAWWINASQWRYGMTKEKAELLYEDIQNILDDKWEHVTHAYTQGRKEDRKEIIKELRGMKIPKGLGMGGPTPDQAYNMAINDILSLLTHSKK